MMLINPIVHKELLVCLRRVDLRFGGIVVLMVRAAFDQHESPARGYAIRELRGLLRQPPLGSKDKRWKSWIPEAPFPLKAYLR